jgi:tetratricopeptide (TPR) repeat protein
MWLLAAVCVIGGLVYFLTRPPELGGGVEPPAAAGSVEQASGVDESQAEQDKIRKGVKEEVARQREKMMADEKAAAALVEAESEEAEREGKVDLSKLEAVRPAQQTTGLKRGAREPVPRPAPGARSDRRRVSPSARGKSGAITSVKRDEGGAMWLAEGKKALAAGNYGTATTMFQQCVNKNAASGECWLGLGNSLQRTGKTAEANAAFDRATALGVRVNRSSP